MFSHRNNRLELTSSLTASSNKPIKFMEKIDVTSDSTNAFDFNTAHPKVTIILKNAFL